MIYCDSLFNKFGAYYLFMSNVGIDVGVLIIFFTPLAIFFLHYYGGKFIFNLNLVSCDDTCVIDFQTAMVKFIIPSAARLYCIYKVL